MDESWKNAANYNSDSRCRDCGGIQLCALTLKVTDFGLSRSLASGKRCVDVAAHRYEYSPIFRQSGRFEGSVSWMAPEVIEKLDYSKASDVWSFGVFLWEILSRKVPFSNYESHVIMYAVSSIISLFNCYAFIIKVKLTSI